MAVNSKLITGLPNLPPEQMAKELWPEFLTIYRAIENLAQQVSEYTGIDVPDGVERASMPSYKYLTGANAGQYYPQVGTTITRGQVVRMSGTFAFPAQANNAANFGIGIADETKAGGTIRVLLSGVTDAIGGMVPGTMYYLHPGVAGAIQNVRPFVAGQIIQPVGWAIDSNHMLVNPSSYFQQL